MTGERVQTSIARNHVLALAIILVTLPARGEDWPGWRSPRGDGVSAETGLPVEWDAASGKNVRWSVEVSGEGASSPIVWGDRIFLAASRDEGTERIVHCLDRDTGRTLWSRSIEDANPE